MQAMAKFRSVFVSDVHLGSRGCRAELLLQFLNAVQTERLYLVGDIVDLWCLRQRAYWPAAHNDVIRAILDRAKAGVRVILIPGNHDEDLRDFDGTVFGNVALHREFVHETADGRRLLVLHGDEFDGVVQCSPWLAKRGAASTAWSAGTSIARACATSTACSTATTVTGSRAARRSPRISAAACG